MNVPDISEAQYCQGDLARAVQTISQHNLTLDSAGAIEAERLIREYGEGNTPMWAHPRYLMTAVHMAQELVRQVREDDEAREVLAAKRKTTP